MEQSEYVDPTLDIVETLWKIGYRQVGVVIQSYLRRAPADIQRMVGLGVRVRLVKGAYREGRDVAFQLKTEVDQAYVALMRTLLEKGAYPAIATHDPAMIAATREFASTHGVSKDAFEFQMLYGIRRDLQASLAAEGYHFRVYVPFGTEWFPYFMRRLGERPANVGFIVRSLVRER
jgi:proline dehydrogenase